MQTRANSNRKKNEKTDMQVQRLTWQRSANRATTFESCHPVVVVDCDAEFLQFIQRSLYLRLGLRFLLYSFFRRSVTVHQRHAIFGTTNAHAHIFYCCRAVCVVWFGNCETESCQLICRWLKLELNRNM